MEIRYHARFDRDTRRIRSRDLSSRLERTIAELKAASNITEVSGVQLMTGWENHYCIRIGDYRLGIALEGDVVVLVRFGHRSDFYRGFP